MPQITINATGLKAVQKQLKDLSMGLSLQPIADNFISLIQKQFQSGVDPYDKPWQPLAQSTIKRKRSSRLLIDSGKLQRSIKATPNSSGILVGLSRSYKSGRTVLIHQTGSGKNPRRQILPETTLPKSWLSVISSQFIAKINATN